MWLDLAILIFAAFLFWRGAANGFLWSVAGPIAFMAATALAFLYYNATQNLLVSLTIGLLGPFLLQWFFVFLMRSFGLMGSDKPSTISSLGGAVVTFAWGMLFVLPVIWMVTWMPAVTPQMETWRKYVQQSYTFQLSQPLIQPLFRTFGINIPPPASVSPASPPAPGTPSGLEALSQDPRMQSLLQDPDMAQAISSHNYAALISHPKFQELIKDPAFIQKIMTLYSQGQIQLPSEQR